MHEIKYKNLTSQKHKKRTISVCERTERKGFLTHTQKRFIYIVKKENKQKIPSTQPTFHITKVYDTKKGTEKVLFRIKGIMEIVKNGDPVRVDYCHSLSIDIEKVPTDMSV